MGGFLLGIGLGWVPHDPGKVHAPGWLIDIAGLVFVSGGLAVLRLTWSRDRRIQPLFTASLLIGIALLCNWVAFGQGERRFTRTQYINNAVVDKRPLAERTGRMAFGAAAVALDLVLVALAVHRLRKRFPTRK